MSLDADERAVESATDAVDHDDDGLDAFTSQAIGRDPGLGLLLELAKRGEYDPWNIDIVALTDRYLQALDERLDARELSHVARLIFYAAALIHMKAQALAEREKRLQQQAQQTFDQSLDALADELRARNGLLPGDQPLLYPDYLTDGGRDGLGLVPRERQPRARGLTLIDLISALKSYDERLAQREAELAELGTVDLDAAHVECVGTAHQDDLDQDIIDVRHHLWDALPEGGALPLEALVRGRVSRAGAYLALLFLAQDEEVHLEQTTFYGEVRVVRGPHFGQVRAGVKKDEDLPAAVAAEDEAEPQADEDAVIDVEDEQEAVAAHGDEELS